jgi:RNA polymerase sigma-70 factor (ECF subfamily)
MLSDTEKYLVESIQKGDYQAFEILFKTYYPGLCALGRSMVHSKETAEDLVSDIFVKIWENPDNLHVTQSLKGYLMRSVRNSCINYLTRSYQKLKHLDSETTEKLLSLLPQNDSDPSGEILTAELEVKIIEAISTLPPECRKIFLLSRREELSNREIADQLNLSENTVKVQIYRGLSKIREALKEYF